MVSLCCSRAGVPQRSMMLLRSMHLLRHILAACPVTAMVRANCLAMLHLLLYQHFCSMCTVGCARCRYQLHVPVVHAEWACLAQADQGAGAQKLLRRPTEPARLPYTPTWGWQRALWGILADAAASASAFVEYPCRIRKVEIDAVHVTGFPSDSMGQARLALFQEVTCSLTPHYINSKQAISAVLEGGAARVGLERQTTNIMPSPRMRQPCVRQEYPSKSWAQYDKRVEATLDIGAAGVVESLLRTTARMPCQGSYAVMLEAQVCRHAQSSTQTASVLSVARPTRVQSLPQRRASGPHSSSEPDSGAWSRAGAAACAHPAAPPAGLAKA